MFLILPMKKSEGEAQVIQRLLKLRMIRITFLMKSCLKYIGVRQTLPMQVVNLPIEETLTVLLFSIKMKKKDKWQKIRKKNSKKVVVFLNQSLRKLNRQNHFIQPKRSIKITIKRILCIMSCIVTDPVEEDLLKSIGE